jgi:DNA-binding MarR family transcriptional regulator
MNSKPLSESFYFALLQFLLQAKQQVIAISGEFGLTSIQSLTLLMLNNIDLPSMSSFCKLYDCDASNITGIIDGLENKKLVSRQPHPSDRRIKIIKLEAKGKTMQTKIIRRLAETSGHLFSGLNETELQQFAALVQKLNSSQSCMSKNVENS